jgi:hypothetical protein
MCANTPPHLEVLVHVYRHTDTPGGHAANLVVKQTERCLRLADR